MNFGEMKLQTRTIAQDLGDTYLWTDDEIGGYLNEGLVEAYRNGKLARSSSLSLGETRATSTITISGSSGTISSLIVNGESIISNPVSYLVNDNTTAAMLANEINDTGLFEATVSNNVINLTPLAGNGSKYNNAVPILIADAPIANITPFTGGIDGICRIQLKPNVREYKISSKVLQIEEYYLGDKQKKLHVCDFRNLNDSQKQIATQKGEVEAVLYGMSTDTIYVSKIPTTKDYINLTVYHLPVSLMRRNSDIPEIPEQYHSKLIHYALYKMYQKSDIEAGQLDISSFHYSKFIEEFGDNQFSAASNRNVNLNFFFGDK